MNFNTLIVRLLSVLRVRPRVGGLEISDDALRFASENGGTWSFVSARLAQGVLVGGTVADKLQFVEALKDLKHQASVQLGSHEIRAIVVLSSANIYSQVFRLPAVEGEHLDEAVSLNLEMASPIDPKTSYSGWHIVGKDEKSSHLEILSAFVNRAQVDDVVSGLEEAGFTAYAVESRALAITRLLREQGTGFDASVPSLALSIDGNGMEFLIIISGQLHFRYFVSWRDVQGEGKEISWDVFQTAFLRHFRQVVNYYGTHWKGQLRDVFLIAGDMKDGVKNLLETNFQFQVKDLAIASGGDVVPEWFAPMGGALRGLTPPHEDRELNLLGMSARKEFRKHEIVGFMKFWRIVVPIALVVLLLGSFGVDLYLVRAEKTVRANAGKSISANDRKEVDTLKDKVKSFNATILSVNTAGNDTFKKMEAFNITDELFRKSSTTLLRFSVQTGGKNVITVSGRAESEDNIAELAEAFKTSQKFQDINLPLTDLVAGDGGVSFSMTFSFISAKTP